MLCSAKHASKVIRRTNVNKKPRLIAKRGYAIRLEPTITRVRRFGGIRLFEPTFIEVEDSTLYEPIKVPKLTQQDLVNVGRSAHDIDSLMQVLAKYGVSKFNDKSLLEQAFKVKYRANGLFNLNPGLKEIGHKLHNLIVSEYFVRKYPYLRDEFLDRVVEHHRGAYLVQLAVQLGLEEYLDITDATAVSNVISLPNYENILYVVIGNAVKSLFAAIKIDQGFDVAKDFILRLHDIPNNFEMEHTIRRVITAPKDPVMSLHSVIHHMGLPLPSYRIFQNNKTQDIRCVVYSLKNELGEAYAKTAVEARKKAAENALLNYYSLSTNETSTRSVTSTLDQKRTPIQSTALPPRKRVIEGYDMESLPSIEDIEAAIDVEKEMRSMVDDSGLASLPPIEHYLGGVLTEQDRLTGEERRAIVARSKLSMSSNVRRKHLAATGKVLYLTKAEEAEANLVHYKELSYTSKSLSRSRSVQKRQAQKMIIGERRYKAYKRKLSDGTLKKKKGNSKAKRK